MKSSFYFYKIRLYVLIMLGIAYWDFAKGQGSSADPITFPRIIPPSPDAQSFIRYGDFPVDYCTGIPKIDIPIYEINTGKLKMPISITYNSGGIRVNDISSVVGLGWKLNAGGLFARTVKGRADETSQGMLTQGYLTKSQIDNASLSSQNYYMFENQSKGNQDTESDNYFYSTGDGLSGSFVYDNNKNITPLSYTTDKIIKHSSTNMFGPTYYLEVIKDDGTRYIFDQQELTLDDAEYFPSTWWLSKIVSANRTDSIICEYEKYATGSGYADFSFSQSMRYGINTVNTGWESLNSRISSNSTVPLLLKKIKFNNGYLQFDYTHDRTDMRVSRLTSVSIYNNSASLLKKFLLEHSYFYSGYSNNKTNYRLKLDKLKMYDGNNAFIGNYVLSYYDNNILPPYIVPGFTTVNASYAVDFWGFYNGKIQNSCMIPNLPAPFTSADRTPDATYAKACILNKITYPTGGYTAFEFESNVKYDNSLSGGLRISSITSKADDISTPIIKRYAYTNNLLGRDIQMDAEGMFKYDQDILSVNQSTCGYWLNNSTIYMSNPVIPLLSHNGVSALYQIVDEYLDDGQNNKLKTTYSYEAQPDIVYSVSSPRYQNEYYIDRSWRRGLLYGINYYKLVNGSYKTVRSIVYVYGDYRTNTIIAGTKVQQKTTNPGSSSCFVNNYPSGTPFNDLFYYFDETIEVGSKKVTQEQIGEYDDNGNLTLSTNKSYLYNSTYHLFPTRIDYSDSQNNVRSTLIRYPSEILIGDYSSMSYLNMLNYPIEETSLVGSNVIGSKLTTYKKNGKGYVPDKVFKLEVSSPFSGSGFTYFNGSTKDSHYSSTAELSYDVYNSINGNLRQTTSRDGITTAYLWDSYGNYPMAEVKGATYSQISTQDGKTCAYSSNTLWTDLNNLVPSAIINTYGYYPLIGLKYTTNPKGTITYYDYDAFGRLRLVRNADYHLVNRYKYNYKQ